MERFELTRVNHDSNQSPGLRFIKDWHSIWDMTVYENQQIEPDLTRFDVIRNCTFCLYHKVFNNGLLRSWWRFELGHWWRRHVGKPTSNRCHRSGSRGGAGHCRGSLPVRTENQVELILYTKFKFWLVRIRADLYNVHTL